MDIKDIASDLKMEKLYFSECTVTRNAEVKNGKMNMNLEKTVDLIDDGRTLVTLDFTVSKENDDLKVRVVAKGIFTIDNPDTAFSQEILNVNTVAIMFPFIRSQVTLMTTQPGMAPIVIPPINTARMK